MKSLLLLPLLLTLLSPVQNPTASPNGGLVTVLGFKCTRSRQNVTTSDPSAAPAREMITANKSIPRNARINDPMGARDPNEDTIDGRSAAIEKVVQESRTPRTKPTDGFAYLVKLQNASSKVVEFLFWEYQFIDPWNLENVTRRQFLCAVKIKPAKEKELRAFGVSGPGVVSVGGLANASGNVFLETVVINRVEYEDGSVWQRKDWNSNEIKLSYQRAVATPWNAGEMCRGL